LNFFPNNFPIMFIQNYKPLGKKDSNMSLKIAKPIPQKMIIVINCLLIMMYKNNLNETFYHHYFILT